MAAEQKYAGIETKRLDKTALHQVLKQFGFVMPTHAEDIRVGHELATNLIGSDIASLQIFQGIQARSGVGMLLHREDDEVTGVAGFLMLTASGAEAVYCGEFNGREPHSEHIAREDENVFATYAWLGAANTHKSRAAVVTVSSGLKAHIFGDLPAFARAVTPEGATAVQTYLGMIGIADRPGLFWNPGSGDWLSRAAAPPISIRPAS